MKINISYIKSLTFEQFKDQFGKHFVIGNEERREKIMKEAHAKAESRFEKPKVEVAVKVTPTDEKFEERKSNK